MNSDMELFSFDRGVIEAGNGGSVAERHQTTSHEASARHTELVMSCQHCAWCIVPRLQIVPDHLYQQNIGVNRNLTAYCAVHGMSTTEVGPQLV